MNTAVITHYLRDNKLARLIVAPYIITRNWLLKKRFANTEDAEFIRSLKGKYAGKRCFIIGNGPSLTPEDLELLKDEITFGCNRIYNIFDRTSWRPDFWMCVDAEVLAEEKENIRNLKGPVKFVRVKKITPKTEAEADLHRVIMYDKYYINKYKNKKRSVSENCDQYFTMSYTVVCFEIELAMYMGFKEICLLGLDHSYPISIDKNGKKIVDPTIKHHFEGGGSDSANLNYTYSDATTQCYEVYKEYADAHGIKITNCTRGGKLEVFPRRKLEDVLAEK